MAKKRKASRLSHQVSVTTDLSTQVEGVDLNDEDEDGPFVDRPIFMDQSTPVSSIAASPATTTPTPAPEGRKTRRRTETSRDPALPDLPADFHRLVNSFVARGGTQQDSAAITDLKADVGEPKTKLGGLEDGIKSIISMLRDGP